jgi:leucyl/phenylalanyl-tRNA--protein transferase
LNENFNPELIISAYLQGYFPMADSRDGDIYWHSPDPRAIIPLNAAKPHRSLRQFLKNNNYNYTIDAAFGRVIRSCSEREDTWINDEIIECYEILHRAGYAHSVETWFEGEIAGGLYGVAIGGAFFGESMFSFLENASKAAFYHLVEHLKQRNFLLLDTQYINHHTELLGAVEIPKTTYLKLLEQAVNAPTRF